MSNTRRLSWLNSLIRRGLTRTAERPRRRTSRPWLEMLDERVMLTAYTVTVGGDATGSGNNPQPGNLRTEILLCLVNGGQNTISFAPSLAGQTITLNKSLITLPTGFANPYGPAAFVVGPSDDITIQGSGVTIQGGGNERLFVIEGGGKLDLENLTLSGGSVTGGKGGAAMGGGTGGGAAGLGGAVLDDGSTFTANGCTFVNNNATGGAGGTRTESPAKPFVSYNAGGGGLGGNGGSARLSSHTSKGVHYLTYSPPGVGGGLNGGAAAMP